MTDFFVTNWMLMLAAVVVTFMSIWVMVDFSRQPKEEQLNRLREWLLYAVIEAERVLGSGTGVLKLRFVYDMFVERFPWMAKVVSFDYFSELVDDALEQMRGMLATNKAVKAIVDGETP